MLRYFFREMPISKLIVPKKEQRELVAVRVTASD